jgi:hypothetical protein
MMGGVYFMIYNRLDGTTSKSFKIGKHGPSIKNSNGDLKVSIQTLDEIPGYEFLIGTDEILTANLKDIPTVGSIINYVEDMTIGTYLNILTEEAQIVTGSVEFSSDTIFKGEIHGPNNFVIDPAIIGDNTGTVIIRGNLQIDGETTTINSQTLEILDKNIELAVGSTNAASSDGAGITIDLGSDGEAVMEYTIDGDSFQFNKSISVPIPDGTSPFNVQSQTMVENLNVEYVGGKSFQDIFNNIIEYGINGGVFITDITAQNPAERTVHTKNFSSDGKVLDSCITDTELIVVYVLAIPGHRNYKPVITINDVVVPISEIDDRTLFTGSLNVDINGMQWVEVIHEDGAKYKTFIEYNPPPEIEEAVFTGGYPGDQTELKENDTYSFRIKTNTPVTKVKFDGSSSYAYKSRVINISPEATQITINDNQIADRGNTSQDLPARVRVQESTGSWSDWFITNHNSSVDGQTTVKLNNLYPTINISSVVYPTGQGAIKNSESAYVNNTINFYDDVQYLSPNNELTIPNENSFNSSKKVIRASGDYNISTNNFRITATRNANNAIISVDSIIKIANVPAILTVNTPATRLISGGNNGSSPQDHTITINSNQNLYEPPTLTAPIGAWQGTGFTGSSNIWVRDLRIHDDDTKGTYTWGSINGKNLSGIETTIITGNNEYILGGFISRDIILAPFSNSTYLYAEVSDYSKLNLNWSIKDLTNKRPVGTTETPDPKSWSIMALNTNPTEIIILDTQATNSSSFSSVIEIEEVA